MGKYSELLRRATNSADYWTQVAIRTFVRDLSNRMAEKDMNKAALAQRIGASPAYVSKVMRGDANFTLETMTKLAMAVGGKVQARIVDADAQVLRPDTGAVAWTLCANRRPRVSRSATIAFGLPADLTAANDWRFMRETRSMAVAESDEMRVA